MPIQNPSASPFTIQTTYHPTDSAAFPGTIFVQGCINGKLLERSLTWVKVNGNTLENHLFAAESVAKHYGWSNGTFLGYRFAFQHV